MGLPLLLLLPVSSRCSVTATIHSFRLAHSLPTKTLAIYSMVAPLGYALSSYCTASVADVNALGSYVMFSTASWVFLGFTLVLRPPASPVVILRVLGSSYIIYFICWCLRHGFSCWFLPMFLFDFPSLPPLGSRSWISYLMWLACG